MKPAVTVDQSTPPPFARQFGAAPDHGGPDLSFHAELPTAGNWRLFLHFQTGGKLHTAALTLRVG